MATSRFQRLALVGQIATGEKSMVSVEISSEDGGAPFVGACAFFTSAKGELFPSRGGLGRLNAQHAAEVAALIAKGGAMLASVGSTPVVAPAKPAAAPAPASNPVVQGGASCAAPAKRKQGRPKGSKNKVRKAA